MITDTVIEGVAGYLNSSGDADLSGVTAYERDLGGNNAYPRIVVLEGGTPEEHEVIKGQWTVPIQLELKTKPEDDEEAATHRKYTKAVNRLIGDSPALLSHLRKDLEAHDSWGGQGETEAEDDYRVTTFSLEIKAAENA